MLFWPCSGATRPKTAYWRSSSARSCRALKPRAKEKSLQTKSRNSNATNLSRSESDPYRILEAATRCFGSAPPFQDDSGDVEGLLFQPARILEATRITNAISPAADSNAPQVTEA